MVSGNEGSLPDLELPPTPLPLSLFSLWFTEFIMKTNSAKNHCLINFIIMFHVLKIEIGVLNTCIDA